jgi:hypothetical protein
MRNKLIRQDEANEIAECDEVSCKVETEIKTSEPIIAHGGDYYHDLEELLRKVLEPRHDFGNASRSGDISSNFGKNYMGSYDNFNPDDLIERLITYIRPGNPFYEKGIIRSRC